MIKSMRRWQIALAIGLALHMADAVGAATPPGPATIWSVLGIPQGIKKINGALVNRGGRHPGLETKPARKALSDPANLESDVPIIKKAAEVKQAEDLKPQKIKAIRYLAKIGCGCYDTDGSITDALLAATSDCTEEVRLATVEAIAEAASGKCCSNCGLSCCCKEAILKRLVQMAYERDEFGCCLEPSKRVRDAAIRALHICCPNSEPVVIEEPEAAEPEKEEPKREGARSEDEREGESSDKADAEDGESDASDAEPAADKAEKADETQKDEQANVNVPSEDSSATADTDSQTAQADWGVVIHADPSRAAAHVHVEPRNSHIPIGTVLYAYHEINGERVFAGCVRVYQSYAGSVNVQAIDADDAGAINVGVTCFLTELQPATDRVARIATLDEPAPLTSTSTATATLTVNDEDAPVITAVPAEHSAVPVTFVSNRSAATVSPTTSDDKSLEQLRSMLRKWK